MWSHLIKLLVTCIIRCDYSIILYNNVLIMFCFEYAHPTSSISLKNLLWPVASYPLATCWIHNLYISAQDRALWSRILLKWLLDSYKAKPCFSLASSWESSPLKHPGYWFINLNPAAAILLKDLPWIWFMQWRNYIYAVKSHKVELGTSF